MVHRTPEKATIVNAAIERHEREGKCRDREGANVFGNALVGVRDRPRGVEALVGSIGKITAQDSTSHRVAPQKPKPFLPEASDHCDEGQGGEDANIDEGLPDETGHVAIGDRRHEIPADVAVDDVERVRGAEQQDQRSEDELGLPTNFGSRKSPNRPDKTNSGRLERNGLGVHDLSLADSPTLTTTNRAYSPI